MVSVGTVCGKTFVFDDLKQQLRCICGTDAIAKAAGAVTALSLSNDHTYVAMGHESGNIYLYELARHQAPGRTVLPTTLAAVATGRKEGHLAGARITALGFVGAPHGHFVLFVEADDTLRILGKYTAAKEKPRRDGSSSILAAEVPPPPRKLVLVGLKPPPRTWHRVRRDEDPNMRGCPAWFPSTTLQDGAPPTVDGKSNGKAHGRALQPVTKPILVFSWTRTFHLICVREEKLPPRPGAKELQGTLVLESGGKWRTEADILTSQWLIVQQLAAVTASSIEVYVMKTLQRVEHTSLRPQTLIQEAGLYAQAEDDVFTEFRVSGLTRANYFSS
ncbi:hypothetical protein AURDEDRAFT_178616 [Auricularia subglabra TFB-10046 SS5]|uniref:WD40 repeat-like protein n=1 Tax=Auricularia subglabra (strain TFB-10046 / SS5) TaxID=717982 RepID=J0WKN7_AURST|nr:hypothetical protein AURDEDRAFT_178616 [Auricularia subglabra TFB-10046 SS5]